jgi:hypothetical protein
VLECHAMAWECPNCGYVNLVPGMSCFKCNTKFEEQPQGNFERSTTTEPARTQVPTAPPPPASKYSTPSQTAPSEELRKISPKTVGIIFMGLIFIVLIYSLTSHKSVGTPTELKHQVDDGVLRASFPWKPKQSKTDAAKIPVTTYVAKRGSYSYVVAYGQFAPSVPTPLPVAQQKAVYNSFLHGSITELKNGTVVSQKISRGGKSDPQFDAVLSGKVNGKDGFARIHLRLHGRLFILTTVSNNAQLFPLYEQFLQQIELSSS